MLKELYVKTNYSFYKSTISIDRLISFALKNNLKELAIIDENPFGFVEFVNKCLENDIKPIIGIEKEIEGLPVLFLFKNNAGYHAFLKGKLKDTFVILPKGSHRLKEKFKNAILGTDEDLKDPEMIYLRCVNALEEKDRETFDVLQKIKGYDDKFSCFLNNQEINSHFLKNTWKLIQKIDIEKEYFYDTLPVVEESLKDLAYKKLREKNLSSSYEERLNLELDIIYKLNFENYFLIVKDYIKYAKSKGVLVGPGRGSSASSLVAYLIGITEIDPLKYDLLFERFLNEERVSMPDIDTDFEDEKVDLVISYLKEKYGEMNVLNIITFSKMKAKTSLKEVGKVLKIDDKLINKLTKLVVKDSLKETYLKNSYFKDVITSSKKLKKLYEIALNIENFYQHTSYHASGIVIGDKPLNEYVPVITSNKLLIGYKMEDLEELGLVKMDLLSLKNLTILKRILNLTQVKLKDISLEDKAVFKLLHLGLNFGIFQFEGEGMGKFLKKLKPTKFSDLYAASALYRPGPIENIDEFIMRKNSNYKVQYPENIKKILEETYGIILYQEQVMSLLKEVGGFSLKEADIVRRLISKKEDFHFKEKFLNYEKYPLEIREKIYRDIEKFSKYGFNKAHAVSYAHVSYYLLYLKRYYPQEFFQVFLNETVHTKDQALIFKELNLFKIKLIKPLVGKSTKKYEIIEEGILLPLKEIKIEKDCDLFDAMFKTKESGLELEEVILKEGFRNFNYNMKTLMFNLDNILKYLEARKLGDFVLKPEIELVEEYSNLELLKIERKVFGTLLSGDLLREVSKNCVSIQNLYRNVGMNLQIVGFIESVKVIKTKNQEEMAFLTLKDNTGKIDVVVFPKQYKAFKNKEGDLVKIYGKVNIRKNLQLNALKIQNVIL